MANGYCEALLLHLESVAGQNYPGQKVTMPGFLNSLLLSPDRPNIVNDVNRGGHYGTARVAYMPRTTASQVTTTDTCAVDVVPAFREVDVTVDNLVQTGVWVPDDTIRQYCEDASRTVAVGQPATQMMSQHLSSVLHAMNGLYQKMENVLTTEMASNFGKHKATGTATAVTVNIKQDATINDLGTGLTKLLADAENNEFCGSPVIVGALGSIFHQFATQFKYRGMMTGDAYNAQAMADAMGFTFYGSGQTGSTWGAQHIGLFSPGSTHLIERLDNVGAFAGQRGSSFFTTITDPRVQCWTPNGLSNVQFDLQVKYIDCPEDLASNIVNGYISKASVTGARGTLLIVKKRYDLFTVPTNAYDGADVIQGQNGTLRYAITNT